MKHVHDWRCHVWAITTVVACVAVLAWIWLASSPGWVGLIAAMAVFITSILTEPANHRKARYE
jgi:hypothetical protein